MKVHYGDQRTKEWKELRLGKATGSAIDVLYAKGKQKGRQTYLEQLVRERIYGLSAVKEFSGTNAMRRGNELEPKARVAYELITDSTVQQAAFCEHDELMAGCSIDGYVGSWDRIIEVKCPNSLTHMEYVRRDRIPSEYIPQITHNLWITGAKFIDFVSYDDRDGVPSEDCIFIKSMPRESFDIQKHEDLVIKFLDDVYDAWDKESQKIGSLYLGEIEHSIWG